MAINLTELTIQKAHTAMRAGDFSSLELTNAYLERIAEKNKEWNVYREVFEDDARTNAVAADERFKNGTAGILTGIPMAIKDNILYENHIASASSKILENYIATYDATVIKILKKEGAVILGRTNMDEFAMGSSTENSAYGPTKNPLDETRVPGGSSGGSAAAVAGFLALAALGSDTGGSIRQPASFCGVVGFMPSYGTVSRSGLIAMASSLDVIGPITRTVADAAILTKVLIQYDENDNTSYRPEMRTEKHLDNSATENSAIKNSDSKNSDSIKRTLRIGVPRSFVSNDGLNSTAKNNFQESLTRLKGLGYEIVDIDIPLIDYSLAVYYVLMPAEVSSNLGRLDGIRYGTRAEADSLQDVYAKSRGQGFGAETRRRIMLGTYVLSHGYYDAYYTKAENLRTAIRRELALAFQKVDFIVTPTTPSGAFKIGEKSADPLSMYLSDLFTVPANIAGIPAISVPSGFDENKMPLGLHFIGRQFGEEELLAVAEDFESK